MSSKTVPTAYERGWNLADWYASQGFDISKDESCPTKNEEFARGYMDRVRELREENLEKSTT